MSDEPELSAGPVILVVGRDEAEDVVVAQHAGLVDLHLSHPGLLVQRGEDLDGHIAAPPDSPPHLPEPSLPDTFRQQDLASHRPLQQQRQPGAGARAGDRHQILGGEKY